MATGSDVRAQIDLFLQSPAYAVVGASEDPRKYGHKVFATYLRHGRTAYPVHPTATGILGHPAYPSLAALPEPVEAVSIITPPAVTEGVVEEAIAAGVRRLWMQPGAESPRAVERARSAGLSVISGGPCLLVELG
ncbi:MAG TPA: CoA-binding protein [Armatimonadota bacterium]|nr:CoA-binding protein [Armatimonadota bacterium]